MILPIDDKYRLKSDAYCWHIQIFKGIPTSGVMKGKEHWKSIRWYQKLSEALNGLAELEVPKAEYDMTSEGTTREGKTVCAAAETSIMGRVVKQTLAVGLPQRSRSFRRR